MSDTTSTQGPAELPANPSVPSLIRPEHKKKLAIVYPRQSSPFQVQNNTGSTESQRALAKLPLAWGWPPELIQVADDDLGVTGTSTILRAGFQRVEALMDRGEVGLVMVRDSGRLTRDTEAGERFLKKAVRAGILLEANGDLVDLARSRPGQLFGLRIHNLLAWWDNEQRKHNFQQAKLAKISLGKAVSRPPIGFIAPTKGEWRKDPQPSVRDAIRAIIEAYLHFLSIRKAAKDLRGRGVMFPKRVRGEINWVEMTDMHVHRVLTNPNYTSDYSYRRRKLVSHDEAGPVRSEKRAPSEWLIITDHHEGYLSRDEFQQIQAMLARRGRGRQPAVGKGFGLLQGLLACRQCGGRWMRTVHDLRATRHQQARVARYECNRTDPCGRVLHRLSCSSIGVDHVVVEAVLAAVTPLGLEAALTIVREDQAQQDAAALARHRQLQRAEERVLDLKRQYLRADPANSRVKAELEQTWDKALRDPAELQRTLSDAPSTPIFTDADAAELVTLAAKLEELWHAPTTTNEDRKHILATVISKILVSESGEDALDLEIVWVSGLSERRQVLRSRGATRLIAAMRSEGRPVSEILCTITERGVTTRRGKLFKRKVLQHKLCMLGFNMKSARLEALRLIRGLLFELRPRQEILHILRTRGPQPYEGEWTGARLVSAIKSIKTGAWAPEIPPLPTGVPTLRRLAPQAIQILVHGRRMGWTFRQCVDELNALGFRTPRGSKFTFLGTYQLYQHLKQDPSLADALPDEEARPARCGRKRGQPPRQDSSQGASAARPTRRAMPSRKNGR